MQTLKQLAEDGHTVVCSIHQVRLDGSARFQSPISRCTRFGKFLPACVVTCDITVDGQEVRAAPSPPPRTFMPHKPRRCCSQPRSSIFELFDDLLLLSEGRAVYSGSAAGAVDYFAARGHPCPERYNPAEFLADLISVDTSSPDAEQTTR